MFMTGQETPFQTAINASDKVMSALTEPGKVDEIILPLLQDILIASKQLLERMIPEIYREGNIWIQVRA
ncbi:hypothetical protein DPMN_137446 [Dreissena polymorpha]|uniref:Uncharacterized protein n=1 Tax=Dreissena polymorpha TaxID=45954 RepID=A0A9D4G5G8_DREPO|nr:hypothetical protein DPMN_137446 [Dreissena polymorpha]